RRARTNNLASARRIDIQMPAAYCKDFDENNAQYVECYAGPMDVQCRFCYALHFALERPSKTFRTCFHKGKVNLPPLNEYPNLLKSLLTNQYAKLKILKIK